MNKTLLGLFKTFLPWMVYSTLFYDFHVNAILAGVISISITLIFTSDYLRKGYLINWVVLINLCFVLLVEIFLPGSYLQRDPWVVSRLILSMVAWGSVIIGKPFTIQYARESVPADKWNQPAFISINKIVSSVWAALFTLSFILHALFVENFLSHHDVTKLLLVLSLSGILFSIHYPNYAREKIRRNKQANG